MKAWKRRARRGFSLAECLVTLLILSLMSSMACAGISNALKDRAQAIRIADAQTVASTVAQAVADQVRYGQIAQVEEDGIVLVSSTYGSGVRLELDSQGRLVAQNVSSDGSGYVPQGRAYALLGEMAYSGLALDGLEFEADMAGDTVKSVRVGLSVGVGGGDSLWSLTYTVAPLNPHLVTGL